MLHDDRQIPLPTPEASARAKWIACGGLTAVVVVMTALGLFAAFHFQHKRPFDPVADAFFEAYNNDAIDTLTPLLTEKARVSEGDGSWRSQWRAASRNLGLYRGKVPSGVSWKSAEGNSAATAKYACAFARGLARVTFDFVRRGETWLIDHVHFEPQETTAQP